MCILSGRGGNSKSLLDCLFSLFVWSLCTNFTHMSCSTCAVLCVLFLLVHEVQSFSFGMSVNFTGVIASRLNLHPFIMTLYAITVLLRFASHSVWNQPSLPKLLLKHTDLDIGTEQAWVRVRGALLKA